VAQTLQREFRVAESPNDAGGRAMHNERTAVIAANREFYRAFSARDVGAMERLWSSRVPVACIHPGWDAIVERGAVLRSWRQILENPSAPKIVCRNETPFVIGDIAFVVCHEVLEAGVLAATNMFQREAEGWKLIHHQASPLAQLPHDEPPSPSRQLH
jgi:ketosteroid isomerase-like protein